jgi:hypothetical protein
LDPRGIALATSDIAILVGIGSTEQYQVINGLNNDNPTHCGGMAVTGGANGIDTINQQDSDVYSYLISGASQNQFLIVEGGSSVGAGSSGSYESGTIDAGNSAAFNRFTTDVSQPQNTTIKMQVAVAQAPAPGTSCDGATFTFVGPSGNSGDFFTPNGGVISGQIPFGSYAPSYQNPARCFRYRAFFTTPDRNVTPKLYDVITNYSQ